MLAKYEVCVIGSGPGGYHAAIRAAQLGANVAMIEEGYLGGLCLNRGCIPIRTMLQSIILLNQIRRAKNFGLTTENADIDFRLVKSRVGQIVDKLSEGLEQVIKSYDINFFRGWGHPISNKKVMVLGKENNKLLECDNVILALGSKPIKPLQNPYKNILSDEDFLGLEEVPSSLLVIGSSEVGCELSYIFSNLGADVTIVEKRAHILPSYDLELSRRFQRTLEKQGIKIFTNVEMIEIDEKNENITAKLRDGKEITVEKLIQTEREANIKNLELNKIGIELQNGFIKVNDKMETSVDNIYAVGDVTGSTTAHEAFVQGVVAAENAQGRASSIRGRPIPRCTFTNPEVVSVGYGEEAAKAAGYQIKVGRFPFSASGRALSLDEERGYVKIIADIEYNVILGIHMIGPLVTELAGEATLLIGLEATLDSVADIIHPHPTLSEALKEAALSALGQSIHLPKMRK